MAADVTVLTTTVNANTSTGTQDITVGSLGTSPSAAIFFVSRVTSTSTEAASPSFCVGFYDGTRNRSMSCFSEDAQTTSDTHRDYSITDAGRVFHSGDGTVDFEFNGDAWITNGVRIYISVSDGNDYKITAILFFGADVSNAYCNNVTVGGSTTTDVTDPGFEPDLVFFSGNGLNGASTSTHNLMNIGVAHNGGNQGSIYFSDVDSLTTTRVSTLLETNEVVGQMHNEAVTWVADCNTFDSSGFSLTTGESTGNDIVAYLALKFTNSPDIAVTTETGPTSTGNWSTTNPAFQPDFGMLLTIDNTATDTIQATDSDGFGVWCFDGTREYSIGMSSDDNVGTTDAYNRHSSDLTDYKDGNTTLHAGSFTSFDTNGATLNFTTVPGTARKWIGIWIGDASAGGGPSTPTGQMALTGAGL